MLARRHMRGIFKPNVHWTESVACDFDARPMLGAHRPARLERLGHNQFSTAAAAADINGKPLQRAEVFGILEQLGCAAAPVLEVAAIGMSRFWRTDVALRRAAAQSVVLAPAIRDAAAAARRRLLAESGAKEFVCLHFRQGDKLVANPLQYDYSAAEVAEILLARRLVRPGEPLYIATGSLLLPTGLVLIAHICCRRAAREHCHGAGAVCGQL